MIIIQLPLPPSTNRYYRRAGNKIILSKEGRDYKKLAALIGKEMRIKPIAGKVLLNVSIYPRKGPGGQRDLDNSIKPVCDALQGVAYQNDKQIKMINIKEWKPWAKGAVKIEVFGFDELINFMAVQESELVSFYDCHR